MRIEIEEQLDLLRDLVRWSGLGIVVGVLAGIGSAAFLHGLNWATDTRLTHPNLLLFLPVAGSAICVA